MTLRESMARLADRFRRDRLSAELDEELRHHAALAARNSTVHDPRSAIHTGRIRESARDTWSLGSFDDLLLDLRFAARVLRRNIGFTTAVILTLALGVGANTAIFSVVDAVLLRPLPYADPDRLVSVAVTPAGSPDERDPASYPDIIDWQRQATHDFTGIAAYAFNRYELTGPEGVDEARATVGTATLYQVLNARPLIGRMPRPGEERLRVVAISERLWRRRYSGRADAVGRPVSLDGQPFTIVGVMPAGFHFPTPDIDLWTSFAPILETPAERLGAPNPWLTSRSLHAYRVVARLAPGATIARAESELNAIERRLAVTYPDDDGGRTIRLRSVRADAIGGVERALWTMLGAAALVLLLACANVAHLMLVRTSTRTREIAVRRALGAHRARVFRQLFTESMLLALLGGAAGIAVAFGATALFVRLSPGDIPRIETVGIDGASLAFALLVSSATGLIFGAAPAFAAWKAGVEQTLRDARASAGGSWRGRRLRSLLTTAEVAGAIVLLVGAGLLVRSFANLLARDIGVEPAGVLAFHISLPGERYAGDVDKSRVVDRLLAAVRAVPGVSFAGSSTSLPPSRMQESDSYMVEGRPAPQPGRSPSAIFAPATTGFAEALGLRVARGRWFGPGDGLDEARVAVVSRTLAERAFPHADPIGQRILISGDTWRIVGVAADAPYEGVGSPIEPVVYVPFANRPSAGAWIAVKTPGSPGALVKSIADAVHSVDPEMSVREPRPLTDMVSDSVVRPRFQTFLITTFGAVALCLALVGIYGVVAYGVAQRTAEIGLRLALGSTRGGVTALVVRGEMAPVIAGVGVGLVVALALSRALSTMVYGVATTDGVTYAVVSGALLAAAAAAVYVPARRASRTDPGLAMR